MRAGLGRHRHAVHAGQRDQPMRQFVDDLERALHGRNRLERVNVGKAGHPRHLFIEPGVVLHRARTERKQPQIDRVVLAAEPRVMTHRFGLGQAGQVERSTAQAGGQFGHRRRHFAIEIDAATPDFANLEQQLFFKVKRAVAGEGCRHCAFVCASDTHRGPPAGWIQVVHAKTSSSARPRFSISSGVVHSLAATSSACPSSGASG